MKRLQVKINDIWEYVFCRNELKSMPVTTKDKTNAIRGDENSMKYFESNYPLEFRISN